MTTTARRPLRAFYEHVDRSMPPDAARVPAQLRMLEAAARSWGPPLRILDLGCGDGAFAAQAATRVQPAVVVALDWADDAMARASARGLLVVQAATDEAHLPFRTASFEVVVMSEVIEHLIDPDLALSEALRVLVPGGTFLLSTPNLAAWFNRLLLLVGIQPVFSEVSRLGVFGRPGSEVVGHLRLFTSRALREVLATHGFTHVKLAGAPYHDVPRPARWLDRILARRPAMAAILLASARSPVAPAPAGGVTDPLFDREDYDAMLARGIALSGETKRFFIDGRLGELRRRLPLDFSARRILDFGCGSGDSCPPLTEMFPGAEVVGVDASAPSLLRAADLHSSGQVSFRDTASLQASDAFDLCYVNGAFHHIPTLERAAVIAGLHRCLRPGGYLVVFENNPWNVGARLVMRRIPFDRDAHLLRPAALRRLVREAGFSEAGRGSLFYFPRRLARLRRFEPPLVHLPLGAQYYVLARR